MVFIKTVPSVDGKIVGVGGGEILYFVPEERRKKEKSGGSESIRYGIPYG